MAIFRLHAPATNFFGHRLRAPAAAGFSGSIHPLEQTQPLPQLVDVRAEAARPREKNPGDECRHTNHDAQHE